MPFVAEVARPAWAEAVGYQGREADLVEHLTYTDKRAAYALRRFTQNDYNYRRFTPDQYAEQLATLKAAVKCSLLRREGSRLLVPAGIAADLARRLNDRFEDGVVMPAPRPMPWHRVPDKVLRPYQQEIVERLVEARHGAVEAAPGLGKTLAALHLVKRLGLPAVVCSPYSAIVQQTYREFLAALGPKRVGLYGDGKKDLRKDVTIATMQALHRATGEAAEFFRAKQVIVGDESHHSASDTLKLVFLDLLGAAPYRFFMSGTQLRTDGLQLLLDGLVGPTVFAMDALQGQDQGFLARMRVRILEINNGVTPRTDDPGKATREALYQGRRVNAVVGALVNRMAAAGRPVLVHVDELEQFSRLAPYLRHEARFAHACTDKKRLAKVVPKDHWDDGGALALSDGFNRQEFPILVGTSCVGTGVDVRATGAGFFLVGGKSETAVRQAAGRYCRLFAGKTDVLVFDVDVTDCPIASKHTLAREKVWRKISNDVQRIKGL